MRDTILLLVGASMLFAGCTFGSRQQRCVEDCGGSPACRQRCELLYRPDEIHPGP